MKYNNERINQILENFPATNNAEEQLKRLVGSIITNSLEEKERLDYELKLIREYKISNLILFYYNLTKSIKDGEYKVDGAANCSYLLFRLGITKVNPLLYNIPFERLVSNETSAIACFHVHVKEDRVGDVFNFLNENYGWERFAVVSTCEKLKTFVLTKKPFSEYGIKTKTKFIAGEKGNWFEQIADMALIEIEKRSLFYFQVETQNKLVANTASKVASEEGILQKVRERVPFNKVDEVERYQGLVEIEEILKTTQNKLIYQEQFYAICAHLGINGLKADQWRKAICKHKQVDCKEIRNFFYDKLGKEAGKTLFDYVYRYLPYTILKAHVLSLM